MSAVIEAERCACSGTDAHVVFFDGGCNKCKKVRSWLGYAWTEGKHYVVVDAQKVPGTKCPALVKLHNKRGGEGLSGGAMYTGKYVQKDVHEWLWKNLNA